MDDNIVATPNIDSPKAYIHHDIPDGDKTISPQTVKEEPLEIYEQEHGESYLNNILEVDNMLPDEFRNDLGVINDYILDLMTKEGYKSTTEAYRAVFKGLKRSLGIDDNMTLESTVNRLSKYIDSENIIRSLKSSDEQKLIKLLKKLPTDQLNRFVMKEVEKRII